MFKLRSNVGPIAELAFFGGSPSFSRPVVVGQPNIPEIDSVLSNFRTVLESGILSNNGPFVRRFEDEICRIAGVEHCVATCNATVALELTARALNLTGEVIVPSFTFIATAHALEWQGLTPVFVDIDPLTHTIDPACIEAAITPATSAICGVHLWGNVCDVPALQHIADKNKLELWFDSSHAFAVSIGGTPVGNFGRAEIFSFHATKFINAFEGGAVVTNDAGLAQTLREMRSFGVAEDGQVANAGINGKMAEVSAAMGLNALGCLDRIKSTNRRNFEAYKEYLSACPGVKLRAPVDPEQSNCQYIVCEIDQSETGLSRDQMLAILEAEGILAKRYFYPGCHRALPYADKHARRGIPLPVTEQLTQSVMVLPTGINVTTEDVEVICGLIRYLIESSAQIRDELLRNRD